MRRLMIWLVIGTLCLCGICALVQRFMPAPWMQVNGFTIIPSPDDKWIATVTYKGVELWNTSSHQQRRIFTVDKKTSALESWVFWRPDSQAIASVGQDGNAIYIWEIFGSDISLKLDRTGREVVKTLRFAPTGNKIVAVDKDGYVEWWNVPQTRLAQRWKLPAPCVMNAAISFDINTIVTACDGTIYTWDLPNQRLAWKQSYTLNDDDFFGSALDVSDNFVAIAADHHIEIFDRATGQHRATLQSYAYSMADIHFSYDEAYIAGVETNCEYEDRSPVMRTLLWKTEDGAWHQIMNYIPYQGTGVSFGAHSNVLYSSFLQGNTYRWQLDKPFWQFW